MKENIAKILKDIIKRLYKIDLENISLEIPPKIDLWDYAFWCFILSKDLKKSPNIIANEIKDYIDEIKTKQNLFNVSLIKSLSCEWPYLNIKIDEIELTKSFIENTITIIKTDNKNDFYLDLRKKQNFWKTIIVDYIWANVWKPLHIGHMCTPNQWQAIINTYKKLWYDVISDSHIWDWWIIFGKLILSYKLWWDEKKLKENAVEHLFELYVKITSETEKNLELEQQTRDEFKKLSSWNKEYIELWREFTRYSIDSMQIQLDRLVIKPDFNIWESFYEGLNLPKMENYPDLKYDMKAIINELIKSWIATENDDDSVWVVFNDESKMPSCILQKRDGTHWYLASDLASIKYRSENWNPDKIIYFVDVRQKLHLSQAFYIANKAWWTKRKWLKDIELIHAYNWFISLKDWAMSTRKWKIIKLDKLLDEAELRAKNIILEKREDIKWEELQELSKIIWIWAIKYWYLKKSRETDIIFDWDEFMTFDWNSWPYIQYAYVRWNRILENIDRNKLIQYININSKLWFTTNEEKYLLSTMLRYKEILNLTIERNMPHILCEYSYNLTKSFNSFYNSIHILSEKDEDIKNIRLYLVLVYVLLIKDCFLILWIKMPDKM